VVVEGIIHLTRKIVMGIIVNFSTKTQTVYRWNGIRKCIFFFEKCMGIKKGRITIPASDILIVK